MSIKSIVVRWSALLENPFIRDVVIRLGGDIAPDIIRIVEEMNDAVTDEFLAEMLGVKITVVRTSLNRLHFWGVADYNVHRDKDTNWYTYMWFIRWDKLKEAILNVIEEEKEELKQKLDELENYIFFECKNKDERVTFEVAVEYQFKCPVCGGELLPVNMEKEKESLKKKIEELNSIEEDIRKA